MTEEFNLSEKILFKNKMGEMQDVFPDDAFLKKDVKEFIKVLKEDFLNDWTNSNGKTFTLDDIRARIHLRAGEKLI